MLSHFKIQEREFAVQLPAAAAGFSVQSSPRPYLVDFVGEGNPGARLLREIRANTSPLLLVDKKIRSLYLDEASAPSEFPSYEIDASEDVKEIASVLSIVDFLERNQATKTSMLYVIGGGILQDLGAFSCAMYKRGLPWTFVPTTLLAQGDSCVGGKTALNHKRTKNLLGLFSTPRRVLIDTGFLQSLESDDLFSGAGEIFRLCITGGKESLAVFVQELPGFLQKDPDATNRLIATSLSVKRAVVEVDEFELDLRRSMNYGHSFGHALEALSNYRIPHGVGVTLGILVENEIAFRRGMLPAEDRELMLQLGRQIVPREFWKTFTQTSLSGVLDLFRRDKKSEGQVLKLATPEFIGQMRFIDFDLTASGEEELRRAVASVLEAS